MTDRELFFRYLAQTSAEPVGLEIVSGSGIYLYSNDNKRYIDLISGIAVSSLGHSHPEVVAAIAEQAAKHMHVMVYGEYIQAPQLRLAEMLVRFLPPELDNVYFTNSGSEAVEGAVKLAKRHSGRPRVVAFHHAYHGHTQGSMSLIGDAGMRQAFIPLLPGTSFLNFNDSGELDRIDERTACVIVEPVQGEAGIRVAERGFLEALAKRCRDTGTLLIFDEAQTGLGRTGSLFAFEQYGIVPDILILAKALGAGMPLGAFIAGRNIMQDLTHDPPLGHITTFGGHPVSCAAALAGLQVLIRGQYWKSVPARTKLFIDQLSAHPSVKEIRHAGFMMAIELGDEMKVKETIRRCFQHGLLTDWFLFCPTALRIAPPLIITEEEIMSATEILLRNIA
ncbi:MAG TPA: aspartate aminotransferase family protein [Bacteroidales bacterium]|nr:aspartate aminotransferase family protein [Bacteroidales bacterium]HSA43246.1 aspartate aminotransferase family protein [Bacteroidales bacterium]